MAILPSTFERGSFAIDYRGVLVASTNTPLMQIIHNNQYYIDPNTTNPLEATINSIDTGIYGYEFEVPDTWLYGDNIACKITYEFNSKTYTQYLRIGIVLYDYSEILTCLLYNKDILELTGYAPNLPLEIDGNTGRAELSDGRGFVKSVDAGDPNIRFVNRVDN